MFVDNVTLFYLFFFQSAIICTGCSLSTCNLDYDDDGVMNDDDGGGGGVGRAAGQW